MKELKLTLLLTIVVSLVSCFSSKPNGTKERKLRHVVAFKFKPGITTQQMKKATTDFLNLKTLIPQVTELEGGPDVDYQKKNGKFTHCFVVTVKSQEDLATYGAHPDHKAFSSSVDPLLAEVMVVDYWTE
jgi:hypothetical protein